MDVNVTMNLLKACNCYIGASLEYIAHAVEILG